MDAADPLRSQAAGPNASDWHWLWEAYIAGLCLAAMVAIVLLNDRIPGNVPVAVAALAVIVACVLTFGRWIIRSPEFDWREEAFDATVLALWVVELGAWRRTVAAIAAFYRL